MSRTTALIAAALLSVSILAGCANVTPTEEDSMSNQAEQDLEARLLDEVDVASGVFVSRSSSGLGNEVVQVRLYTDIDDAQQLATGVETAFRTTWNSWPQRPEAIQMELVVGPKPADADTLALDLRDLDDVAAILEMPDEAVNMVIRLNKSVLTERYGE